MERTKEYHTLEPWVDAGARVLILGTFPSPKSREYGSYYGHPQNRFWKTVAAVFREPIPLTVHERKVFVCRHHIALWDVIASCEIHGANDASIAKPIANDIAGILNRAPIQAIFTTGKKAKALYDKLLFPQTQKEAVALPSTSPANRRWFSEEALIEEYQILRSYCE